VIRERRWQGVWIKDRRRTGCLDEGQEGRGVFRLGTGWGEAGVV